MTVTMAGAVKKRTAPQVRIYINGQGWVGSPYAPKILALPNLG